MRLSVRLRRVAYRCAYNVLQGWWWIRRPRLQGVKCVITDGPNVLLVRHTYGRRCWDLPGGKVERGEEPVTAGRREMLEELGLDISSWRWIAKLEVVADHRHDTLTCFHAEVAAPELTVELAEIAQTGWFQRFELPADLSPHAAVIIELLAA